MKADADLDPGSSPPRRFVPADPDLAVNGAYLLNVVEVLRGTVAGEAGAATKARITESTVIIARVAHALQALAKAIPVVKSRPVDAAEWLALAQREGAALDEAEARVAASSAKLGSEGSGAPGPAFDPTKFEAYLRARHSGSAGIRITEFRVVPGGRSKQTVLVRQEGADDLPADLVVRRDWASAVTGTSVVDEFALLKLVAEAGLKVPKPILLEPSTEPLGTPFMVVPRISGAPYGDMFNPLPSETLALDLATQLGKLHSLPIAEFESAGVPVDAYTPEQLRAGVGRFRAFQQRIGLPSATIEIGLDWMERNIPRVTGGPALVHNDLGCHNFLIEDEKLTAILDWEIAQIGNPAADLGYIRGFVEKMTGWEKFMATYRAAGGPDIAPVTLDFYQLWSGIRLYCLLIQARAGVAARMVRDTEITYACANFIPQLVHRLSRELRRILNTPGNL